MSEKDCEYRLSRFYSLKRELYDSVRIPRRYGFLTNILHTSGEPCVHKVYSTLLVPGGKENLAKGEREIEIYQQILAEEKMLGNVQCTMYVHCHKQTFILYRARIIFCHVQYSTSGRIQNLLLFTPNSLQ